MKLIRLTENRIIDISRFVALIPSNNDDNYLLILEGSSEGILIHDNDLSILTKYLGDEKELFTTSKTEYTLTNLAKPQAVEILQARIARHESMSDTEAAQKAEAWERFKQNIDAERPDGCKLYS
ncbi:hypothetical protein F7734_35005 [Scytonema sp. UIC 10036]|uniref:hypothetical protein n=1 Tax=Scytonema sp. UIC 10036 TaxID=2304196 RepID=UPI0012DA0F8C|nr:hypothetical protein [Scytonema sp. UIC 10036]MUG97263.1 hypothetical protein [Scytonema sp. UIC 10036]